MDQIPHRAEESILHDNMPSKVSYVNFQKGGIREKYTIVKTPRLLYKKECGNFYL